ncbi:membrane-associated guanylate kinase, WW and PDZ domain-containing protein 1-like [Tubulanus polymorphus]|uniref:membrane-associated guanylate kinase, WW and PDZ domain-containing protein 1-like n=1 Tax=Tubulanus polymorphus TaxID=672921 RepID=UPI003DA68993
MSPVDSPASQRQQKLNSSSSFPPGNPLHPSGNPLHPSGNPLHPSAQYNAPSTRKQTTSFESTEPTPGGGTVAPPPRLSRADRLHSNSLDSNSPSSRSPTRYAVADGDNEFFETTVFLRRLENGFGFRIIGGTEEGSQVSVGHIVPGGAADLDARLRTGDEIIYVDGLSVVGSSHHKVVELVGNAGLAGRVTLGIRRRLRHNSESQYHSQASQLDSIYPYDVVVNRLENEGFGFIIISSMAKTGSILGRIIENSPAERCTRLHVGDRIVAVNGINIIQMHHEDIVNMIKESGYSVTLTVGPPLDDTSSTNSASQPSSQGSMINALAFPAVSESDLSSRKSDYSPFRDRYSTSKAKDVAPRRGYSLESAEIHNVRHPDDDEYVLVELYRGSRGFGFSIRGGQEFGGMPLYVLKIAEGGAAHVDGRLQVGDQILEVNGINANNMSHAQAIELIQSGGSMLRLLIRRTGIPPPAIVAEPSPSKTPDLRHSASVTNGPISQSSPNISRVLSARDAGASGAMGGLYMDTQLHLGQF